MWWCDIIGSAWLLSLLWVVSLSPWSTPALDISDDDGSCTKCGNYDLADKEYLVWGGWIWINADITDADSNEGWVRTFPKYPKERGDPPEVHPEVCWCRHQPVVIICQPAGTALWTAIGSTLFLKKDHLCISHIFKDTLICRLHVIESNIGM